MYRAGLCFSDTSAMVCAALRLAGFTLAPGTRCAGGRTGLAAASELQTRDTGLPRRST